MTIRGISRGGMYVVLLVGTMFLACTTPPKAESNTEFTAPSPERVAALLDFNGPVKLILRIAPTNELARTDPRNGVPFASFSYADRERSSESLVITVFKAGTSFGPDRAELEKWLREVPTRMPRHQSSLGIFQAKDGRPLYQFLAGMGPGGGAYGALIQCRDSRYELVIIMTTDFHEDEDQKEYADYSRPTKELKAIIEEVERLVMR